MGKELWHFMEGNNLFQLKNIGRKKSSIRLEEWIERLRSNVNCSHSGMKTKPGEILHKHLGDMVVDLITAPNYFTSCKKVIYSHFCCCELPVPLTGYGYTFALAMRLIWIKWMRSMCHVPAETVYFFVFFLILYYLKYYI